MKVLSDKILDTEELEDFSVMIVNNYGEKNWRDKDGLLHREDGPAFEGCNADKAWYQHNQLHREDGPAVEDSDGTKVWYQHGLCHRENGPAAEYTDGTKVWYQHGLCHRENGPAVERANGDKIWYLNDQLVSEADVRALGKMK